MQLLQCKADLLTRLPHPPVTAWLNCKHGRLATESPNGNKAGSAGDTRWEAHPSWVSHHCMAASNRDHTSADIFSWMFCSEDRCRLELQPEKGMTHRTCDNFLPAQLISSHLTRVSVECRRTDTVREHRQIYLHAQHANRSKSGPVERSHRP